MPTSVVDSQGCLHTNALPYRSAYLHYCVDCGRTVFVGTGGLGFESDKVRGIHRGVVEEPFQTKGDTEEIQ